MSPVNLTDVERTQGLQEGDPCEWRYPARREWKRGTVRFNGGSGYWVVVDEDGIERHGLYIEHVRAVGTNPWVF